jgi:hypothetical protein
LTPVIVAPATSGAGQILAVIERWRAAAGQRDVATIAGFYTEDAQLFPPNTAPVQGREKAAEIWRGILSLPNVALNWEPTRDRGRGQRRSGLCGRHLFAWVRW